MKESESVDSFVFKDGAKEVSISEQSNVNETNRVLFYIMAERLALEPLVTFSKEADRADSARALLPTRDSVTVTRRVQHDHGCERRDAGDHRYF